MTTYSKPFFIVAAGVSCHLEWGCRNERRAPGDPPSRESVDHGDTGYDHRWTDLARLSATPRPLLRPSSFALWSALWPTLGNVTRNTAPDPSLLSTSISPPCASTKRLARARPRPVPAE